MKKIKIFALIIAVIMLLSSCGSDYPKVMEYNGHYFRENFYSYWLSTYKRNILLSYSDAFDTSSFWNREYDEDSTIEDYFTEIIENRIKDYLIAEVLFREYGLSLDSETKKAIKDDINEKIEYYGGKKSLNKELEEIKLTVDDLTQIYTAEEKYNAVCEKLFGDGGTMAPTDSEITKYYTDNYCRIKYIVFYTTKIQTYENGDYVYDEDGYLVMEDMTEEELKLKKAEIEECCERLKNGEDFDTLRIEYSEYDTSAYENGFFISSNEVDVWGDLIINAARSASEGEVVRVEEESSVYLIQKLPLTDIGDLTESDITQLASLNTYVEREKIEEFFSTYRDKITLNEEVLSQYSLSGIKSNPFYGF